jgi:hypothetical protein
MKRQGRPRVKPGVTTERNVFPRPFSAQIPVPENRHSFILLGEFREFPARGREAIASVPFHRGIRPCGKTLVS